jgi:hypothetical protein
MAALGAAPIEPEVVSPVEAAALSEATGSGYGRAGSDRCLNLDIVLYDLA